MERGFSVGECRSGFLCAALFLFFAKPTPTALLIGASVSILGLALRAWAAGHIRKNAQLATSGPYAFTRNPLYLGSFLLGLGFTIASGRLLLGLLFAALFLGIYLPVMRVEASTMAQLFGSEYDMYRQSVPLFFPRITPFREGETAGEQIRWYPLSSLPRVSRSTWARHCVGIAFN